MQLEAFLRSRRPLMVGNRPRRLEWVVIRGFPCMRRHTFVECLAIRRMYKVTNRRKKFMATVDPEEVEYARGFVVSEAKKI